MKTRRLYLANLFSAILPSRANQFKSRLYRWAGVKVGNNVSFFQGARILGEGEVIIGDNVFIGLNATIMTNKGSKVIVEDYGMVGHMSVIVTGFHPITPEGPRIIGFEGTTSTVVIKQGASLGVRAILLPGKTLGRMSHAAAGSIVTHDVEEFTRVAGVPARVIRNFKEGIKDD